MGSDSVEARRSDSVEARRSARGMAGAPRDGDPSRLWHILAASASFLTTTDARRIEGGAKALAAAIKLSNSAQRMIASPFYPILPSLTEASRVFTVASYAKRGDPRHRSREPSTGEAPLPAEGSH